MFVKASTAMEGLSGNGKASPTSLYVRPLDGFRCRCNNVEPHYKCPNWSANILQTERAKLLEGQTKPVWHHDRAPPARRRCLPGGHSAWAFGRHVHYVAVDIERHLELHRLR